VFVKADDKYITFLVFPRRHAIIKMRIHERVIGVNIHAGLLPHILTFGSYLYAKDLLYNKGSLSNDNHDGVIETNNNYPFSNSGTDSSVISFHV
jgi:hypothetical protein